MKELKLSYEVASVLAGKLSVMKTANNKIRLSLGVKRTGDNNLGCRAVVVSNTAMASIGFATSGCPSDYEEGKEYIKVVVGAAEFVSYLSALSVYQADIIVKYNEEKNCLILAVRGQAEVKLPCVQESEAEPLFNEDFNANAMLKVKGDVSFLKTLERGGFCAETAMDVSAISDRVVLDFSPESMKVYSIDRNKSVLATSGCQIKASFNRDKLAVCFLKKHMDTLSEEEGASFKASFKELSGEARFAKLAECGFKENRYCVAVPTVNIQLLEKIFAGAEAFMVQLTERYLSVTDGTVAVSVLLSDKCTTAFDQMLSLYGKIAWDKVVVDKEKFMNALGVMKISKFAGDLPVSLAVGEGKLTVKSSDGSVVRVPVISGEVSEPVTKYYNTGKLLSLISKMPAGNVCIGISSNKNASTLFRDGDLEGKNSVLTSYLSSVNFDDAKRALENKLAKEAKKNEGAEEE